MTKLKALWAKLNVKTALLGGALVVTTALGTCTFQPAEAPQPEVEVAEEE